MLKNITVLFGISMLWIHASQAPEKFGQHIGQNSLTPAYSNGQEDHVSDVPHYIIVDDCLVKTGMKWQCVEYARRWLIQNKGLTFDDVTYAWQIWD
ncbi:MAG: hypothetical protein Q8K36_04385, partial [Alphaproteobacteria bacterium]|nr:hypothetical protein [Alphaproteobacteria bacterium]